MAKDNNIIFWIIGIVVLVALIINSQVPKEEEGLIGLNVHYYKDGVEVVPKKGFLGFSVVTPPGGSYDQISLSISGSSENISFSNIQIVNAYPLAFKNALPTTIQTLSIGQTKTLFSSNFMDTIQFESMTQPVGFWVNVSAVNDYTEETEYAKGYIDLTIEGETCVPAACASGKTDEGVSCVDGICTRICSYYTYSCVNPTVISSSSGSKDMVAKYYPGGICYEALGTSSYTIDKTNYCWKVNSYSAFTNIQYSGKTPQVWGRAYAGGYSTYKTVAIPVTSFSVSRTQCWNPSSSYTGLSGCHGIVSGTGNQGITTAIRFGGWCLIGEATTTASWSYSYTRYTAQSTLNYDNKVCSI